MNKKHGVVLVGELSLPLNTENAGDQMGRFVSHGSGHSSPGSWLPWGSPSRSPGSRHFFLRLKQFVCRLKLKRKLSGRRKKIPLSVIYQFA